MEFYQENDVWQAILTEQDPLEQRRKALEFAKLLLETVTPTKQELNAWDEDNLIDLLLEYNSIGEQTQAFLAQASPRLDLEEGEASFAAQLQQLQQQIKQQTQTCIRIEQQRREWQAETQRLQAETQKKESLERQALEEKAQHAEQEAQRLKIIQAEVEKMQQHLSELENTIQQLASAPAQLEKLSERATQQESQAVAHVLDAVSRVIKLLQQLRDTYQTHGTEDQRLEKAFRYLPDIEGFAKPAQELSELSRELDHRLKHFDALLRDLINALEKQQNSLRQRREQ